MKILGYFLNVLNACLYHQTLDLHDYLSEFSLPSVMNLFLKNVFLKKLLISIKKKYAVSPLHLKQK